MCLIVVAYDAHPKYSLVVAANRDESFARPTDRAHFWESTPDLLAGRDAQAGGTWLGLTRQGRFGAVTNFRDPAQFGREALSRGELLRDSLLAEGSPREFFAANQDRIHEYNGYNILTVDLPRKASGASNEMIYHTNSDASQPDGRIDTLEPGFYGLSNDLLDTPWPKLNKARAGLERILGASGDSPDALLPALLDLMTDEERAADADLPDTGIGLDFERLLSSVFIPGETYGTCSTTVLAVDRVGRAYFRERPYEPGKVQGPERDFQFDLSL